MSEEKEEEEFDGLTEIDEARLFCTSNSEHLRYLESASTWLQFDKDHWNHFSDNAAKRLAIEYAQAEMKKHLEGDLGKFEEAESSKRLKKLMTDRSISAIIRLAAAMPQTQLHAQDLDKNLFYFNTQTSTLNLEKLDELTNTFP